MKKKKIYNYMTKYKIEYNILGGSTQAPVTNINRTYNLEDMPQLCFGLVNHSNDYKILKENIKIALNQGYRHFDGAEVYGSISYKNVLKEVFSPINRKDFWLTWKDNDISVQKVSKIIQELDCDYIDLFLTHHNCGNINDYNELQKCKNLGYIRYWGVSNCEDYEIILNLKINYDIYANQIQARPPGGVVQHRGKLEDNFVDLCNQNGIKIMLFGTISGINNGFNIPNNLPNFEYLLNNLKNINKYYKQKYITQYNGNVLMVSSNYGSSIVTNYKEFYDNNLLNDEEMNEINNILINFILHKQ